MTLSPTPFPTEAAPPGANPAPVFAMPDAAALEEMDPTPPAPTPKPRFLYWETIDPVSNSPYPLD
ncbi:hypothetical protein F0P96_00605 [Hymenobacter busanensis]|uniref:Uncharacterized protein n=1 Tax=Hymenobacter busanensis TaxID=2607656 RepID=A0AA88K1E5_9BACT|nr:hypothetical protein [Hymenobacter busanensis]KAA9339167.1 hypothetical protein F0P96_00605 [Hymenobacter busanensis]